MRFDTLQAMPAVLLALLVVTAAAGPLAENIDPDDDGSQYAWAENIGWINTEPSGDGGPGMLVSDFELTGWLWSENAGWIRLSCQTGGSCESTDFGVDNDGSGNLSGFAWSENAGWIDFAPSTSGVTIDTTTGDFSGRAWGENVGWITFASAGPFPYKVKTAWNCDPAPAVPSAVPELTLGVAGADTLLSWSAPPGATGYDVVRGDLGLLRSSGGDFQVATQACLAGKVTSTSATVSAAPPAGSAFWFLVRAANCGGDGSYDSGGSFQVGLRDAEIAASGAACP